MLLSGVLDRAPGARGVLLDTPETIEMAVKDDRIEARAGDFFDGVPAGGDLYLIKNVLHDWEKEDAGRILANIRRAGRPGHRLVVCEWLIPGNGEAPIAPYLIDLILLSSVGGRSRTADEFRELLTANGYAVDQVTPLSGGQHLVVAHAP